jgi:hypothetical protein
MIVWNMSLLGVLLVDVRGVHIPRHHREQLDVLAAEGAGERGGLADDDLVERPVLDEDPGPGHSRNRLRMSVCCSSRLALVTR